MRDSKPGNSIWSTVLLLSLSASPVLAEANTPASASKPQPLIKLPQEGTLGIEVLRDPEYLFKKQLKKQVADLVKTKDFAGLDAVTDGLRKSKTTYPDGQWHLGTFYEDFALSADQQKSEELWKERFQFLNDWIKQNPKSPTARAALVDAWTTYAWCARGGGYANTVTDAGWKKFEERIKKADEAFLEGVKLPVVCPKLYTAEETVALAQSRKLKDFDKIYNAGVKLEPTYHGFYFRKMYYLLPRWEGKPGEFEAFLAKTADKMGKDAGDIFYAQLVWEFNDFDIEGEQIFTHTKLSWPRTKRGLELMLKQKPGWAPVQARYALLATLADDKPAARAMFNQIGRRADKLTWSKAWFRYRKDQAFSDDLINDPKKADKDAPAKTDDDDDKDDDSSSK